MKAVTSKICSRSPPLYIQIANTLAIGDELWLKDTIFIDGQCFRYQGSSQDSKDGSATQLRKIQNTTMYQVVRVHGANSK